MAPRSRGAAKKRRSIAAAAAAALAATAIALERRIAGAYCFSRCEARPRYHCRAHGSAAIDVSADRSRYFRDSDTGARAHPMDVAASPRLRLLQQSDADRRISRNGTRRRVGRETAGPPALDVAGAAAALRNPWTLRNPRARLPALPRYVTDV